MPWNRRQLVLELTKYRRCLLLQRPPKQFVFQYCDCDSKRKGRETFFPDIRRYLHRLVLLSGSVWFSITNLIVYKFCFLPPIGRRWKGTVRMFRFH